MTRRRPKAIVCAMVALLLLAACGDDSPSGAVPESGERPESTTTTDHDDDDGGGGEADGQSGTFPVTVTADNGEVTIEQRPERIVSLSAAATEILFAVDAGPQVIAVDSRSDHPTGAPTIDDLEAFNASAEAVAEHDPDLVVLAYDPGDVIASLELLDIPVLHLDAPSDFDGVYRQIELLGAATGNVGTAAALVATMSAEVDEIVAGLPEHARGLTYFHELDDMYYTVTSHTFIGQVYALLGLESIADAADPDGSSGGYPQLSEEYIIEADPHLIFLADAACCGQSAATVAARPGWGELRAVTGGGVIEIDESVASRWGPRIIDLLRSVAEAVAELEPAA